MINLRSEFQDPHSVESLGVYPVEMTLKASAKSTLLNGPEYASLVSAELLKTAENLFPTEGGSLARYEIISGSPSRYNVQHKKGTIAEFYIREEKDFSSIESRLNQGGIDASQHALHEIDGALVYVRIIQEGKLFYPEVLYTEEDQRSRHIAQAFTKSVPYLGDAEELRRKEKRQERKNTLTLASEILGTVAAVGSLATMLVQYSHQAHIANIDHELQSAISSPLSESQIAQLKDVMIEGTDTQRNNAFTYFKGAALKAVQAPRYLGKTDNTYSGPYYFSRVANDVIGKTGDIEQRTKLEEFKFEIHKAGDPVLMKGFDYYASRAALPQGMSAVEAKAMAWEHVMVAAKYLNSNSTTRPEKLKLANQLGMVIYSSSKAIPALRFDYQRSIIPECANIDDEAAKTTLFNWVDRQ